MSDSYDWTPDLWEGEEVLWQRRPTQSAYVFSWNDFVLALFIVGSFEWAIEDKSASRVSLPEKLNAYLVLFCIFFMCVLIWRLSQGAFQGMWIDGPPDILGSHSDGSLYFLAMKDADTVIATVASRFGSTP